MDADGEVEEKLATDGRVALKQPFAIGHGYTRIMRSGVVLEAVLKIYPP